MRAFLMGMVLLAVMVAGGCTTDLDGLTGRSSKAAIKPVASDLLRTYAEQPVSTQAQLVVTAGFGSILEGKARTAFVEAAKARGFRVQIVDNVDRVNDGGLNDGPDDLGPDSLQVQFSFDAPPLAGQTPWQSPIQVAPPINPQARPLNGNQLTTSDFDGPPNVVFVPRKSPASPVIENIKIRVTISDGSTTLWTGFAYGALDGRARSGLVRAMATGLADVIGQETDRSAFFFAPVAGPAYATEIAK